MEFILDNNLDYYSGPEWIKDNILKGLYISMYCYIDNKKVDLDYLSKYHPGGKKIQAFENMDATVIYKSMHMHSDDRIDKYVLYDDEYKYNSSDNKNILDSDYIFDTEFSKEVRSKVRNSIANYYAPLGWWLRFI